MSNKGQILISRFVSDLLKSEFVIFSSKPTRIPRKNAFSAFKTPILNEKFINWPLLRNLTLLLFFITSLTISPLLAEDGGHKITVEIENYDQTEAYLASYISDTPYILDTVAMKDGVVVFSGEEHLEPGVYLIVLPPDNKFIQIFVDHNNQNFTLKANYAKLDEQAFSVTGSPANQLFYEYVNFLSKKGPEARDLQEQIKAAEGAGKSTDKLQNKLQDVNISVRNYQAELVKNNPDSPVATWVSFGFEVDIPEFEGPESEVQFQRYIFRKTHFFDNVNFTDSSLYRNPMLPKKINYYLNQLTPATPDSIIISLDYILNKVKPVQKTFRFYLSQFLNQYAEEAQTKIGMDAVYVHLVDNYYARGMAPWVKEETLDKIKLEAQRRRPTLIGRRAMNVEMRKEDGSKISLYDIESKYTVLYFWRYDCSHCKKSTPHVVEFYNKFKDKGVKVMGTCVKLKEKDMEECWKYVHEKEMEDWINVVDPGNLSKFTAKYDTRITPRIFILDKDKKILINRIGAEQLEEVMDQIIAEDNLKLKESLENK